MTPHWSGCAFFSIRSAYLNLNAPTGFVDHLPTLVESSLESGNLIAQ
ncbi:hypothetical protein ABH945_005851 [Paraburkholderia sp. GAS333]